MNARQLAALHQGMPGKMTWLEDPPPWLRPAYCFASVIAWTENFNKLPYLIALFVLFWQWKNQRRWRPVFWGQRLKKCTPSLRVTWLDDFLTLKWPGSFTAMAPPLGPDTLKVATPMSPSQQILERPLFYFIARFNLRSSRYKLSVADIRFNMTA